MKRSVDENNCENYKLISKSKNEGENVRKHLQTAHIAHYIKQFQQLNCHFEQSSDLGTETQLLDKIVYLSEVNLVIRLIIFCYVIQLTSFKLFNES